MTSLDRFRAVIKSRDRHVYGPAARELRQWMMAHDPHWPTYHFLGPESWTNDANGPIFYQGRYHLFYQFDPIVAGARSPRTWGHAISDDLVHWEDWPVALWPDTLYDRGGVYSGNTFVLDDGALGALYTGNVDGHGEAHGIFARSTDQGLTWHKQMVMHNSQRPNPHSPVHWDAQVWREDDAWFQLIGGCTDGADRQGAAYLWRSPDLQKWTLCANIAPTIRLGSYWELPYLIDLGGRHVLMVGQGNPYWIGTYDRARMRFTPDQPEPLQFDTGNYYAVNPHMVDNKGPDGSQRRLLFAWVTGPPSPTSATSDCVPYWQGAIALPRVLTLKDNRVWQEPIPELQQLRGRHFAFDSWESARVGLRAVQGDTLEIRATFLPASASMDRQASIGLKLRVSEDGADFVRIFYDVAFGEFGVDGPTVARNAQESVHDRQGIRLERQHAYLRPGEPVTMHIFLDRSIVEVFVSGSAYTARAFPPSDAFGIELCAASDFVTLTRLDIWELKSIW
ncbi:MAG: GH32 C-terminal domain-containing protein [Caldilineaceae bacterium]